MGYYKQDLSKKKFSKHNNKLIWWCFYLVETSSEIIEHLKYIPHKHSITSFIYVQSQKQHNKVLCWAFNKVFSLIDHIDPIRFSDNSFKICGFNLKLTRFAIGFRGPKIGKIFLRKVKRIILAFLTLKTWLK